jgi:zinc transporter ZupT
MGQLGVVAIALLSAAGFLGASLLAVVGSTVAAAFRPYAAPVAGGVLLAIAFSDVAPEALDLAGDRATLALVGAFTFFYLLETLTHAAEHDRPTGVDHGGLGALVVGLCVHNAADGFALGATDHLAGGATGLVGLGVLIHQMPVGLSFAGILLAQEAPRREVVRWSLAVALVIPAATALTVLLPVHSDDAVGAMMDASAGLLIYVGAAHLLPEVRAQRHNRAAALVFAATLLLVTIMSMTLTG